MASSQIEVTSSSTFDCVLKDHNNRRDRRNPNPSSNPKLQSNFPRNLKKLVRDHLHSRISLSPRGSNSETDENSNYLNQSSTSSCWNGGKTSHQSTNGNGKQNSSNILVATQMEKEMTIEKQQDQEVEVIALSLISSSASSSMREASPTPSENDFSVSSLVQKWREAEARNSHPNNNSGITQPQNSSPCSSPRPDHVNDEPSRANSILSLSTFESAIEERQVNDDDSSTFEDYDSNKQQAGTIKIVSDVEEIERIRVADIVRKWAQTTQAANYDEGVNHNQQLNPFGGCSTRLRIGMDKGRGEQNGVPVVCSPRIRGRQAIADMFMTMEKERYKEIDSLASRQLVSKFCQRGRIQSLLKLRFLRQEVFGQDKKLLLPQLADRHNQRRPPLSKSTDRRPSLPKLVESNSTKTMHTIKSIREKFSTTVDQGSASAISTQRDAMKTNIEEQKISTSRQPSKQVSSQNSQGLFNIKSCTIETTGNRSMELTIKCNQESQKTFNQEALATHHTETTNGNVNVEMIIQEFQQQKRSNLEENSIASQLPLIDKDTVCQNMVTEVIEHLHDDIPSEVTWGNNYEGVLNLEIQENVTMSYSGWEEEEEEAVITEERRARAQQYFEPNLDWIADIARPRGYWEDRRQAWYEEVFNTRSKDEEIRQLLERGNVTIVLASDFRDKMDQLITCSVQRAMHSIVTETQLEDQSMGVIVNHCMPLFNCNNLAEVEEVHKDGREVTEYLGQEERKEDKLQNEVDDNEEEDDVDEYYDPTPSLTQCQWDHYQDHEAIDDSYNAPSTSVQPPPLPGFDPNTHAGSPFKNSTIEMELIHDLRAHMEQLYQEMSELRKSLASCMRMQMKLQHSVKEEVSVAINSPKSAKKREKTKDSNIRHPKKGNCCICYEKKVDSLLYRCGHMCTCFNCAHELQWSSGKCPICRAQIIDVVRAYPDN